MCLKMPAHSDFSTTLGIERIKCLKFGPSFWKVIGIATNKIDYKNPQQNPRPSLNGCDYSIANITYPLSIYVACSYLKLSDKGGETIEDVLRQLN